MKKHLYTASALCGLIIIALGSIFITQPRHATMSCNRFYGITSAPECIPGKIVTLKKLKDEYFIDHHNMFSNTVRDSFESPKHITLDYTIRYLRRIMQNCDEEKSLYYCIFDNKDNVLIGGIDIRERNELDNGQLGCWLNEHYWGHGRMQEALKLITKTYFALHPEATDYIAHVRPWNKRSYHALRKFGFADKGYIYENGKATRHLMEYRKQR